MQEGGDEIFSSLFLGGDSLSLFNSFSIHGRANTWCFLGFPGLFFLPRNFLSATWRKNILDFFPDAVKETSLLLFFFLFQNNPIVFFFCLLFHRKKA